MELASHIKEELLICKICFIRFSKEKLPKMLLCSHTFCEQCLVSAIKIEQSANESSKFKSKKKSPESFISCPLCRQKTKLQDNGVQALLNNYTVLGLMDMVGSLCRIDSQDSEDEEEILGAMAPKPESEKPKPQSFPGQSLNTRSEQCAQCNKKYPESQLMCGHCICDKCLEWFLVTHKEPDACPLCTKGTLTSQDKAQTRSKSDTNIKNLATKENNSRGDQWGGARPKEYPGNGFERQIPADRNSNDSLQATKPTSLPPKPAPRMFIRPKSKSPPSMSPELVVSPTGSVKSLPERPPPFNPGFSETPVAEVERNIPTINTLSPTKPKPIPRERSVSPMFNKASPRSNCSPSITEDDTVSLCSIKSELTPGSNYPEPSPLRRSQSMRQPPPLPKRKYGTLPRSNRLIPPVQNLFPHGSAENLQNWHSSQPTLCHGEGESLFNRPSAPVGHSPPVPPPRRIFSNPKSTTKCVKKFGTYCESSIQTSGFRKPARISLSEKNDIVVVDTEMMTVQVFTMAGDYLSMFKVLGVQDASFIAIDKLCVASHRGIHIYMTSGSLVTEFPVGQTVATTSFKFGFIAATPKTLLVYRQSLALVKEISRWKVSTPTKKWSPIQKKKTQMQFQNICDLAVTSSKSVAIFDSGANSIVVMDNDGHNVHVIDLSLLPCNSLKNAGGLAADRNGNFFIADTENHRVLKISNNGTSFQSLVSFRGRDPNSKRLFPNGLTITDTDYLIVALSGIQTAEIRIYATNLT